MAQVSQVTTVKDRSADVLRNLPRWVASGVDEIILVDWDDPDHIGLKLVQDCGKQYPQLNVLKLSPEITGPYFHLTRARNLGARATRHEIIFFCDADAYATARGIDNAREAFEAGDTDLMVGGEEHAYLEQLMDVPPYILPGTFDLDGQCFCRNSLFYAINGYNEDLVNWGAESYDFYLRARQYQARPLTVERGDVKIDTHKDEVRDRHLKIKFNEQNTRQSLYAENYAKARKGRRHFRATPGRPNSSVLQAHLNHVRLISSRGNFAWNGVS